MFSLGGTTLAGKSVGTKDLQVLNNLRELLNGGDGLTQRLDAVQQEAGGEGVGEVQQVRTHRCEERCAIAVLLDRCCCHTSFYRISVRFE
jgi:hypothetical protein